MSVDLSGSDQQVVSALGDFTTALFPITPEGRETISYPGTGTFVSVDGHCYILTARHVWDVLRKVSEVGLTLREHLNHTFSIPVAAIDAYGPPPEDIESGPDLTLLHLPNEIVSGINVYRTFYNLRRARRSEGSGGTLVPVRERDAFFAQTGNNLEAEGRVLMGTPKVFATLLPTHASVQIDGIFLGIDAQPHAVNDYDYLDFTISITPGIPRTFEGYSGGGLWRYFVHIERGTGKTTIRDRVLEGVAFYQTDLENDKRTIRCHGKQSIERLLEFLPHT